MTSKGRASKLLTAKRLREKAERGDLSFEEELPPEESSPEEPMKIREYSDWIKRLTCSVCGEEREPYVEVEVDGVSEFTCRECYDVGEAPSERAPRTACPSCREPLDIGDRFCGKCGAPVKAVCESCGDEAGPEDRFCGKCGASL